MDIAPIQSSGVYAIIHKESKSVYIGQSKRRMGRRWAEHVERLKNKLHHCEHLQNIYNKKGNLEFCLLQDAALSLLELEYAWICYFQRIGYRVVNTIRPYFKAVVSIEQTVDFTELVYYEMRHIWRFRMSVEKPSNAAKDRHYRSLKGKSNRKYVKPKKPVIRLPLRDSDLVYKHSR